MATNMQTDSALNPQRADAAAASEQTSLLAVDVDLEAAFHDQRPEDRDAAPRREAAMALVGSRRAGAR